jgi:hypothetical protein
MVRRQSTIGTNDNLYEFDPEQIECFIAENLDAGLEFLKTKRGGFFFYQKVPVHWSKELLVIPFQPKYPLSRFQEKCNIFLSKKKPLLISIQLAN